MKKRFVLGSMLSFSLLLASCQEEATQLELENVEAPVQQKIEVDEQVSDYHQGYVKVLAHYMTGYGMLGYEEVAFYDEYRAGLLYAELLDFDQDGFEELYIIYKDVDFKGGINGYVQEVWSTTDAAQPAKQLHMSPVTFHEDYDDLEVLPNGIGYVTLPDGQIAIRATALDLIGQMPHDDHAIFTLQNGQFELYERYILNALDNWTYKKNGKVITEEEYTTQLEALAVNTTWIIEDAYNTEFTYPIDFAVAIDNINALQQQLTDTLQVELSDAATILNQADEKSLQVLQEKYSYLRQLDTTKETADSLAVYYIFTNQLDSGQNEDYLLVYDVAQIIDKAKVEFGIELTAADFEVMNTPPNDVLYYEDGTIISSIFDGFVFEEKNEVKRAKQLHDNVYYVEYENILLDIYGDFLTEQDMQTPISQWSSEKLQAVTNHGLQYVVVDLVEEGKLLYKSSQPLRADELAKF